MLTSLLTSTISLLLGPQPLALGLDAHRLVQLPRARLPVCEIAAPEAAAASQQQLSAIPAAPDPSTASFDLAEQLSERGALPHGPWRHAFRAITTDHDFLHHGWAKQAFKLEESWPFAIGAYTMDDVARDVTLLPPGFVAHGVEANGGIFNKALSEGFTFADVDAAMDGATVVMLNAGFLVPKLARVSLAMLEASGLPIWLNVYLSKPGLKRSTQLHTDKQDVLLVQCTGRKRWRVYRPPPPADTPGHDPFARGKGTDSMTHRAEDLVVDTVMAPGQVLYIPAGFPHETDTVGEAETESSAAAAMQPSVHLTVGIDTHLWGLSYAKMREVALNRARQATGLPGGLPLTNLPQPAWSVLHEALPVGFLAAPVLTPLCVGGRGAAVDLDDASAMLSKAMATDMARRMAEAEPERFAAEASASADELVSTLGLLEVAQRMIAHHQAVLGVQASMYRRTAMMSPASGAAHDAPARSEDHVMEQMNADMDMLDAHMANLEAWSNGVEAPAPVAAPPSSKASAKPKEAKAGFGGGGAKGGAKKGKAKGGKKRK